MKCRFSVAIELAIREEQMKWPDPRALYTLSGMSREGIGLLRLSLLP